MKRLSFLLVGILILTTNLYSQDTQNSPNIEIKYSYDSEYKIHNCMSTPFKISNQDSNKIYCGIHVWAVDGDETAFITFKIVEIPANTTLFPIDKTQRTHITIKTERDNFINTNSRISNVKNLRKDTSSALIDFDSDNSDLSRFKASFKHRYLLSELCDDDIISITIGKHTLNFIDVQTSKIFMEIFKKLAEETNNEIYKYMASMSRSFGKLDKKNRR